MTNNAMTVSIIGHRDLVPEHLDSIKNRIETILQNIKDQYPNRLLHFMSPLAEGSDQVGAEVALLLGFNLIAPLPMKIDEYLKNFDEYSKQTFDNLLIQTEEYFVLECRKCLSREDHYLNLGKYLIHNSNILLVLWDGNYSDKIGGTGYIMKHLDELKTTSFSLEKIIHLRIPRKRNLKIDNFFEIKIINTKSI